MRRLFASLSLLIVLLLTVPAVTTAQTPATGPDATPQASPLPGLEYYAARQYAPDPANPVNTGGEGLFILTVRIYEFDSEEQANIGWESTVESTAIESQVPTGSDKVEFEERELDDLGDRAWVTILAAETPEGETGHFRLVYVQDGAMLYTLSAIAGSADATTITDDFARAIVDREPGDGEVRFNPDGTSTGGVWDLLPPADDEMLTGLIAFSDAEHTPTD